MSRREGGPTLLFNNDLPSCGFFLCAIAVCTCALQRGTSLCCAARQQNGPAAGRSWARMGTMLVLEQKASVTGGEDWWLVERDETDAGGMVRIVGGEKNKGVTEYGSSGTVVSALG